MKKFRFRLEGVLKIKRFQAEQLQMEVASIQAKVQNEQKQLVQMYENIEQSYALALEYKKNGKNIQGLLDQVDAHIYGERHHIKEKSDQIRILKQELERKEYEWLEMRKEVKKLEVLKDKKEQIFKKEMQKREQKEMDDLVNMRRKVVG
tara:strand:+ start:3273 stop:3719 length:447 start_codon:yes stop_codon:yes gene_type:complete